MNTLLSTKLTILGCLIALSACQSRSQDTPSGQPSGSDLETLYACQETDFSPLLPLVGPKVVDGKLPPLNADGYVLHSTQLLVRPGSEQEALALSIAVIDDAMKIPGFVAMSAAESKACGFMRTYGIWENEEAMFALLATKTHGDAVARSSAISYSAKTVSWGATAAEAASFSWEIARERLELEEPSPLY